MALSDILQDYSLDNEVVAAAFLANHQLFFNAMMYSLAVAYFVWFLSFLRFVAKPRRS